jgi:glycosyltransferase involved in cell wall biosynthesis
MSPILENKEERISGKKILVFIQSQEIGGVETSLLNLLSSWPNKCDEFTIWCNRSYKGKDLYKSFNINCEVISFPTIDEIYESIDAAKFPKVFKKIVKIIVSLTKYIIFCASVIFFVKKLKNRHFDIIFSDNGGYPAAKLCLSMIIASKIAKVGKIFLIIHSCSSPMKFLFQPLERLLDKMVSRSCSEIITISNACAVQLQNSRFQDRELKVIYNGISPVRTDRMSLKDKRNVLGIQEGVEIIGLIGDYEKLKGHEPLMRAFIEISRKYPQAKLVFIGSDTYEYSKYLKNLTKTLNIEDRVIFTGYLENAWEYIECFKVLVLPSIAYEGFGMVLLEAMLYKKPVIGTQVGGIPEVIGDAGYIVKPNAYKELTDAIDRLLRGPDLCDELGKKGFIRLNNKFTASRMAKEYFELTRA